MALNLGARYPGQTASDPSNYPWGKARNVVSSGDGTGTPWEADIPNDIFGFLQALLSAAGITPSGTPDKLGASQYLQAIQQLITNIPFRVIGMGEIVGGILQSFSGTTGTTLDHSSLSIPSLQVGDIVELQFVPIHVDNSSSGAIALLYVEVSENGGTYGAIRTFQFASGVVDTITIVQSHTVTAAGTFAVKLVGGQASAGSNTNVNNLNGSGTRTAWYKVYRPSP